MPLGAADNLVHFGSGKSSAAPAWLAQKGGESLGCGRAGCPAARWLPRRSGMPDDARLVSAGSRAGCLSAREPGLASHARDGAAPAAGPAGSGLFRPSPRSFGCCSSRGNVGKWFGWVCVCIGGAAPTGPPPFPGSP